jgi:hypothetical protein
MTVRTPYPESRKHGLRPPWRKGQGSPNPGGRPKRTPFANACRRIAALKVGAGAESQLRILPGDSVATAAAKRMAMDCIMAGSVAAFNAIADRTEGRVQQSVQLASAVTEMGEQQPILIRVIEDDGESWEARRKRIKTEAISDSEETRRGSL